MIRVTYLLKEFALPFIMTTVVLSGILLMNSIYLIIPLLENLGNPTFFLIRVVIYSLPSILPNSIPLGIMIGVYIGMNRLSNDSEIIALRASGISISFLFKPVLILAGIASLVTGAQSLFLSPMAKSALEDMKFNILKKQTTIHFEAQKIHHFGDKLIYVFEGDGEEKRGIFIANWDNPDSEAVLEAKEGNIEFDEIRQSVVFHLRNGRIHFAQEDGTYRIIHYQKFDYDIQIPKLGGAEEKHQTGDGSRDRHRSEILTHELYRLIQQAPAKKEGKDYRYITEFHTRFIPLIVCFSFAFFSVPLGITSPRTPKSAGPLILFVLFVFYWLLHSQAYILANQGKAPAPMLYLSGTLVLLLALGYFYKKNNDITTFKELIQNLKSLKKEEKTPTPRE